MKTDNSLLLALALLEKTKSQLRVDTREQLSRAGLTVVKQSIVQALEKINASEMSNIFISGNLVTVVECIDTMLSDDSYSETDTATKDIIVDKVLDSLAKLYVEVGKYYETHEFDYSPRLSPILGRVIENCLQSGYYFGRNV